MDNFPEQSPPELRTMDEVHPFQPGLGFQSSPVRDHATNRDSPVNDDPNLIDTQKLRCLSLNEDITDDLAKVADRKEGSLNCGDLDAGVVTDERFGHENDSEKIKELEEEGLWENDLDGKEHCVKEERGSAGSIEFKKDALEGRRNETAERTNENEETENNSSLVEGDDGENVAGDTGATTGLNDGKARWHHYPLRPDAEDCSYYMRAGTCKFGSHCKFNHPLRRKNQFMHAGKETVKRKEESSDKPGQIDCKYYLSQEGCRYGSACKYNHGRGRPAVALFLEFNFLGLPIRPGEKECPFYMQNGSCKYGSNCRFNHPDPTVTGSGPPGFDVESAPLKTASHKNLSSCASPRSLNETASFVPMIYPPTQAIPSPNTEWDDYQTPVYPISERSLPTPPAFALNNPHLDANLYVHPQHQMLVEEFPERPGQLDCSYFMKTGDCKFRSSCKFHHPRSRIAKNFPSVLSNKPLPLRPAPVYPVSEKSLPAQPGFPVNSVQFDAKLYTHPQQRMPVGEFPERPGQPECSYFMKTGDCKYQSSCKFHHPRSRIIKNSPSVLSDIGLPLRPDQNICTYYSRYGICKYGPSCKYDHPVNYSYSASGGGGSGPSRTASETSVIQQLV